MLHYLYIKTHEITGLKYLGKTKSKNPYKYPGSGKRWKRHIAKHGKYIKTEILLATENKSELKETGLFFSLLWDVVNSSEWANCIPESGEGGDTSAFIDYEYAKAQRNQKSVKEKRERIINEKYDGNFYKNLHLLGLEGIQAKYGVDNPMYNIDIKRKHKESLPKNHQSGDKNSQFGKKFAFVCSECEIKKIPLEYLDEYLKNGYIKGRKWRPLEESNLEPSILR